MNKLITQLMKSKLEFCYFKLMYNNKLMLWFITNRDIFSQLGIFCLTGALNSWGLGSLRTLANPHV